MKTSLRPLLAIIVLAILAGGCGGGSSAGEGANFDDIRACLKDADLTISKVPEEKDTVSDAVFATSGIASTGSEQPVDFVMAIAAEVKEAETADKFKSDAKGLSDTLAQGGGEKLTVTSGTDGKYVWVVAGAKGADGVSEATECVKP